MHNSQILEDLRGFVPLSVLASAMWTGGNEQVLAITLKRIVDSDTPFLLMLDEFDDHIKATDEAKAWARKYLFKCLRKPRLLRSHRVHARVGWRAEEIVRIDGVREMLPDIFGAGWKEIRDNQSEPTAATPPGPAQNKHPAEVITDGLVAWQAAMLESWPKMVQAHTTKPTPRSAMRWLKKYGPRNVFPEQQLSSDALAWRDLSGNLQTVSIKTIQNQFSIWKADGMIPG